MKDMGVAEKIMSMEIKNYRVEKKLFMCQKEYIQKVVNRFGMTSTKLVYTPLTTSIRLSELYITQSESKKKYMPYVTYATVIGSLMYSMVCTRPDLAQTANVVSSYMGNPEMEHWQAVKNILRYLKGTTNIGIIFHGDMSCAFPLVTQILTKQQIQLQVDL